MTTPQLRLPTRTLILFGMVNLPLSMLMSPTAAILPNFYLEYSAVSLAGLATATFIARLFDGLSDPLIGYLSDRSGTRKPWMVLGALLVAGSSWFLFNPDGDARFGYLVFWYLLVTLGWTLVEFPHTAMAAELSTGYHERSRIARYASAAVFPRHAGAVRSCDGSRREPVCHLHQPAPWPDRQGSAYRLADDAGDGAGDAALVAGHEALGQASCLGRGCPGVDRDAADGALD